jgi:hypothetical protein
MNTSVWEAFRYLDRNDDDGTFSFAEVYDISQRFPYTFYPIYRLQQQIMKNTLGTFYWEWQKSSLHEFLSAERIREQARLREQQESAKRVLETMNEEVIRRRMGLLYYLMPWDRAKERRKIARIAAIENELDEIVINDRSFKKQS